MGSLYSLSAVYMTYRHTARKPACQQIHEALSIVEGGGCDPCVCVCVCMLIYVWVCLCMGSFVVWCGCEDIGNDARFSSAALCACLCMKIYLFVKAYLSV